MSASNSPAGTHSGQKTPITGTLAVQNGHLLFSGFLPVKGFDNFKADRLPKGYQRPPKPSRKPKIKSFYSDKSNIMPNPLLVNLRDNVEKLLDRIEFVGDDEAKVRKAIAEKGNCVVHVVLFLTDAEVKWLVDGQHRFEYFIAEVLKDNDAEFLDMPIPVTFTLGLTRDQERQNFVFVNDEAKGVPKSVQQPNLAAMIEDKNNPYVRHSHSISEGDMKAGAITGTWEYDGYRVINRLRSKTGVWGGKAILDLGEEEPHTEYLLQSQQFSRSLTPIISGNAPALIAGVLGLPYLTADNVGDLLDAYWSGIAAVYPDAFAGTSKQRKKYAIQKGQGVFSFHRLLPNVLAQFVNRYDAKAAFDPDKWEEFLSPVADLAFDLPDGTEVNGHLFWLSGQAGAAGTFSGDSGRKRLFLMLKHLMDEEARALAASGTGS